MSIVLLILALPCAGFGAYLLVDFFQWSVMGRVVSATITGFQDKTSKRLKLPVVSFENEEGKSLSANAERIDQFLFLFNRPGVDDFTTVIYREGKPPRARIYGYTNVVAGLLLWAPLIIAVGMRLGKTVFLGQAAYVLIFVAIALGGWMFLKFIQRHY